MPGVAKPETPIISSTLTAAALIPWGIVAANPPPEPMGASGRREWLHPDRDRRARLVQQHCPCPSRGWHLGKRTGNLNRSQVGRVQNRSKFDVRGCCNHARGSDCLCRRHPADDQMIDHKGASAGNDECEEKNGQYSSIHMGACLNRLSYRFRLTVSLAYGAVSKETSFQIRAEPSGGAFSTNKMDKFRREISVHCFPPGLYKLEHEFLPRRWHNFEVSR
jgi:hypothetical protein